MRPTCPRPATALPARFIVGRHLLTRCPGNILETVEFGRTLQPSPTSIGSMGDAGTAPNSPYDNLRRVAALQETWPWPRTDNEAIKKRRSRSRKSQKRPPQLLSPKVMRAEAARANGRRGLPNLAMNSIGPIRVAPAERDADVACCEPADRGET
jgi:hypothetical protein